MDLADSVSATQLRPSAGGPRAWCRAPPDPIPRPEGGSQLNETNAQLDFSKPAELHEVQRRLLGEMLREVLASNRFYQRKLADVAFDPRQDSLETLPFTTRDEIQADQRDHPPYGCNLTYPPDRYVRVHQTSGTTGVPLRWLDTAESWAWWKACWAAIYRAAGLTPADRIFIPFSFGPFVGFWSAFDSAVSLGQFTMPAGGMTTSARLRYMLDHGSTFVCCTPTYALRMAEFASDEGIDLAASAVRAVIVAGEPGGNIPATRGRIESSWGARVFDHVGMTEVGAWGFECREAPGGVHVNESAFIAEVVDPESGEPVADQQPGELVLTNLGRTGSPMIRYRTGDQIQLQRKRCACGRWFAWAKGGILGRLDDMLVIRGNNVFPSAVEGILREFDEVAEFRLEIDQSRPMADLVIQVERREAAQAADARSSSGDSAGARDLAERIQSAVRDRLHFSVSVEVVDPGTLPRFELKSNRVVRRGTG